jgi:hypothetical protein
MKTRYRSNNRDWTRFDFLDDDWSDSWKPRRKPGLSNAIIHQYHRLLNQVDRLRVQWDKAIDRRRMHEIANRGPMKSPVPILLKDKVAQRGAVLVEPSLRDRMIEIVKNHPSAFNIPPKQDHSDGS